MLTRNEYNEYNKFETIILRDLNIKSPQWASQTTVIKGEYCCFRSKHS